MSIAVHAAAISSRPSNASAGYSRGGYKAPHEMTSEEYTRSLLPAPAWYGLVKVAVAVATFSAVVWALV
jgi:hypothetical protein